MKPEYQLFSQDGLKVNSYCMMTDDHWHDVAGGFNDTTLRITRMQALLLLTTFLWLRLTISCAAQSSPVSILNVNNGLLSGSVECGIYDSRGFIWIGTREGLHRYDGRNIVKYLPDPSDPDAIKSSATFRMAEDRRGHLFILGNAGLEVFLPEENRFALIEGAGGGDLETFSNIWIDNQSGFGVVTELNWGEYILFSLDSFKILGDSTSITQPQRAITNQLWQWKRKDNNNIIQFRYEAKLDHKNIGHAVQGFGQLISLKPEGWSIWAGYVNRKGFYRFPFGSDEPEWISLQNLEEKFPENTRLTFHDYNDSLAIAFAEGFGLLLFKKKTGEILDDWDFRKDYATSKFTSCKFMFNDPSGRVWFSLMPYGVFVIDPLSPRFQILRNSIPGTILYNGLLRSMACDTKGRLWAGYNDGHIQVLDPELTREVFNFDIRYNELAKTKMPVESIVLFPNGHVVANSNFEFTEHANQFNCNRITEGNGIAVLGGTFNTLKAPPSSAFPVDSQARKWTIYTQERMETYTLPFNEFPLVKTFAIDQDVFFEYAINNYKILSRTHGKQLKADYSGPVQKINSIFQFPGSDSLWLATVNGLGIYQISADKLQMLNTKSWPSQYLYGLIPDRKGNMWISSNAGVIRYTPATGHWKCFDVRDGMQSNEFNTNCFALMRDDALAFGGPEGINVFDPAYFDSRHIPFRVFFTGIKINEKPVEGFNPYHEAFSFSIRPNQKSLEIEYSSTLYDDRESIHYFVQLEGAEENWVDMRDKEFVRYINLKPGDYTFRLKAVNADDEWSQNYMEARVKVIPAFFQTTWFLILCFIVLGALIYGSYTYRIRQIKKLQTVRNRISHDLHDDVGSTLGSISIYSEVAKTLSAENREDVLDKIGEASREMLDKLNDIVWSINPENDTLEKLETRMRAYAAMVLYPKAIDFTMETSSQYANTTMTMEVRRNLFLVFKEAIYNIAKYSGCRQVEIRLTESKGSIRLEIKDDGKGFDPTLQDAYNGNGLKSMKERAKAIQGTLQIISAPGAGTQILLDA